MKCDTCDKLNQCKKYLKVMPTGGCIGYNEQIPTKDMIDHYFNVKERIKDLSALVGTICLSVIIIAILLYFLIYMIPDAIHRIPVRDWFYAMLTVITVFGLGGWMVWSVNRLIERKK